MHGGALVLYLWGDDVVRRDAVMMQLAKGQQFERLGIIISRRIRASSDWPYILEGRDPILTAYIMPALNEPSPRLADQMGGVLAAGRGKAAFRQTENYRVRRVATPLLY